MFRLPGRRRVVEPRRALTGPHHANTHRYDGPRPDVAAAADLISRALTA